MYARIRTAVYEGIEGRVIEVQSGLQAGLPYFNLVGLAAATVVEARERIRSAITHAGYEYPRGRLTVNLAPAGIRKNGSQLDLPIALGVLATELTVDAQRAAKYGILGELSLDGRVVHVDGLLPMLLAMEAEGVRSVIVPYDNLREAALAERLEIIGVRTLEEAVRVVNGMGGASSAAGGWSGSAAAAPAGEASPRPSNFPTAMKCGDYADIQGQENAKRAMMIAAAGKHATLMIGSPGCGKTMLARRLPGIMPEMDRKEMIESTIIYSVMGQLDPSQGYAAERPFRMPHHTIGAAGLLGGGLYPVPGEITMAHHGVLFLDEFCEFEKSVLEGLRVPMEDKQITLFRRGRAYVFPCDCLLVMAANPCPCGYLGDSSHECKCSAADIERYRRKLSGPMLDRIDLHLRMDTVTYDDLENADNPSMSTAEMRSMVINAQAFSRLNGRGTCCGNISDDKIREACCFGRSERNFLEKMYKQMKMTPRTYMKTMKVARTIADLEQSVNVTEEHLAEACRYRELSQFEREYIM